jgi:hypothetical protein
MPLKWRAGEKMEEERGEEARKEFIVSSGGKE